MFYLYHNHDLHRLADVFSLLRQAQSAGPLATDLVLVPNAGVGRWLKMRLALQDGVAANLDTQLSAPFLWDLIARSLPGERPDSSAYRRENLRWHLYALLPEVAGSVREVGAYLAGDDAEVRRWQLAEQLAAVFDEYLIYRRTMLLAWERGESETAPPGSWQAPLWRALVQRLGPDHRARALGRLVRRVETEEPLQRGHWPERLYCFALGNLPPDYLRLLYAVARSTDVHFFLHNPSAEYWGDIQAQPVALAVTPQEADLPGEDGVLQGHPLLASLGRPGRDFIRLLYSDEFADIRELELGEVLEYCVPGDKTLLHRLQSGVIQMQATPEALEMDATDGSLQIHSCHGVLREVQVLHDQLLGMLSADDTLEPRDIIVVMPDVSAFAPAVEAVFGAASGRAYIPFSLSDRPASGTHPIVQTFVTLLDLPLWRWTSGEIMSLVDVPAVRRRFGLDEADVESLRRWVEKAGVRWGIDADHRARSGAGHWQHASWRFGIDRLLAGVMVSQGDVLIDGIAPEVDLEGGATAALGQFWLLLERLDHWRVELVRATSAAAWQERLNALCADLFAIDGQDRTEQLAVQILADTVAGLGAGAEQIGDAFISWEAVRELVSASLAGGGGRQPLLSGGVTFCGLQALRTVPFRVVCIIGLNDGAFPRAEQGRSMNLVRREPRLGDISVRDDDRLLFLQWLLSAGDVFYLSYTGQDTRSGETLPPATVVSELLDFVAAVHFPEKTRDALEERLVTKQPMQPFSPRYYEDTAGVFTFRTSWHAGARAMYGQRAPLPGLVDGAEAPRVRIEQIAMEELKRFFENPARWFLRDVVQLDLDVRLSALQEEELREVQQMDLYRLYQALYASAIHGPLPEEPPALLLAQALLPPEPLSRVAYDEAAPAMNALVQLSAQRVPDMPEQPGLIDVDLGNGLRVTGKVQGARAGALYRVEPRRVSGRHLLPHWLDLVAFASMQDGASLNLYGLEKGKQGDAVQVWQATLEHELAVRCMRELVDVYLTGQQRPLRFMPDLAGRYLEAMDKGEQAALDACNAACTADRGRPWDISDPWFRRVVEPSSQPLGQQVQGNEFCALAQTILGPMLANLKVEGSAG